MDRLALRERLLLCINPLEPTEHPQCLINVASGEIVQNPEINVEQSIEIGKLQLKTFIHSLPESFHEKLGNRVVKWTADKKNIGIGGGQKVCDTDVFYARALASERDDAPSIQDMLDTELAPVATSMFEDNGDFRTTVKSVLKNDLAVEKSARMLHISAYFMDGCAVLWVIPFPAGTATVQTFLESFRKHIRGYQKVAEVYLPFDR